MKNRTRRGGAITRAAYTTRTAKRAFAKTRTAMRRRRPRMTQTGPRRSTRVVALTIKKGMPTAITRAASTAQKPMSRTTKRALEEIIMTVQFNPEEFNYYIRKVGALGNEIIAILNTPTIRNSSQHRGITDQLRKKLGHMELELGLAQKGTKKGMPYFIEAIEYRKQVARLRAAVEELATIRKGGHAAAATAGKQLVDDDLADLFGQMSTKGD